MGRDLSLWLATGRNLLLVPDFLQPAEWRVAYVALEGAAVVGGALET